MYVSLIYDADIKCRVVSLRCAVSHVCGYDTRHRVLHPVYDVRFLYELQRKSQKRKLVSPITHYLPAVTVKKIVCTANTALRLIVPSIRTIYLNALYIRTLYIVRVYCTSHDVRCILYAVYCTLYDESCIM